MAAGRPKSAGTSVVGSSGGFTTIAQPRAHDFVVEQIRRQIALGILAPGSALPAERELMKIFGVGRVTVQLAIGQLEAEHIVETRRGRNGGSFVKSLDADSRALDLRVVELRRHSDRVKQAVEYRRMLEPEATACAAGKIRKAQLNVMAGIVEKTALADDDAEFMRWDTAFHLAIAEATANQFMVEGLERIRLELNPALQLLPDTPVWHELSVKEHHAILDALVRKDPDGARELMAAHITHAEQSIHSLLKTLSRR
ncbi:FadR family transcriptional regulator [Mycobacterium sp. 21AC1]|uniref:FadR/GntR family transcriptional regulator n=1 Tax=[Mycobacterium] appelbergii TaxID=2939269 RepID=UPI0029390412|nr:FadR/GntR family transcriptional regulator [Mycobacterium sp. 21AC1]MDV3128952.1 FadR family transcriptional regulator [Mycobacterium sp. 21AC1]